MRRRVEHHHAMLAREARGGEWEDLPADTFKEEGTAVRVFEAPTA